MIINSNQSISHFNNKAIIPTYKNPQKRVPIDPTVLCSSQSPFHDFNEFLRLKKVKALRELEEIWAFTQCKKKGPIMDVYIYLNKLAKDPSELVKKTAIRIIEYLDSTRIRGL